VPPLHRLDMVVPGHRVPALMVSSGHNATASPTFNTKADEVASSRASNTRQELPSPSRRPNVSSGVIGLHHPVGGKPPPGSTGNDEEPCFNLHRLQTNRCRATVRLTLCM
jgi:hypothetical protein